MAKVYFMPRVLRINGQRRSSEGSNRPRLRDMAMTRRPMNILSGGSQFNLFRNNVLYFPVLLHQATYVDKGLK